MLEAEVSVTAEERAEGSAAAEEEVEAPAAAEEEATVHAASTASYRTCPGMPGMPVASHQPSSSSELPSPSSAEVYDAPCFRLYSS